MTQSDFGARRPFPAAHVLVAFFLTITLAACGSGDEASAQSDEAELTYKMGEPITDANLAAIVTSDYGSDTLTSAECHDRFEPIATPVPHLRTRPDPATAQRHN